MCRGRRRTRTLSCRALCMGSFTCGTSARPSHHLDHSQLTMGLGHRRCVAAASISCRVASSFTIHVQVAFARHNEFLVASAHDSELHIWDVRRGGPTDPVVIIPAHAQKIYGIDWSRNAATADQLLSCSQDRSVRFWSVSSPESALSSISTPEPVYRASYAPFGNGVITVAARASNAIRLWHAGRLVDPRGCRTAPHCEAS